MNFLSGVAIAIVALGLAVLAVLSVAPKSHQGAVAPPNEPELTRYDIGSVAGRVYEFTLADGTRCVALGRSGGITCDWDRN